MRRIRFALALLLALLPTASAPLRMDAKPALWVVRDADTTLYLFGTVHALPPHIGWFEGKIRSAFNASDTLVLELVMPNPAAMATLVTEAGIDPSGTPLRATLPAPVRERLDAALPALRLTPALLDHMDPWLAATTLSVRALERLGYAQANGVEASLADAAARSGKPVEGLETAREQLAMFDSLPLPAQRAMLVETIDGLPSTRETMATMVATWRAGDADALADHLNADLAGAADLQTIVLTRRNARWADWITQRMERPGTVFIAVGAGHLAGDASVQALLTRRGLKVERIQ